MLHLRVPLVSIEHFLDKEGIGTLIPASMLWVCCTYRYVEADPVRECYQDIVSWRHFETAMFVVVLGSTCV